MTKRLFIDAAHPEEIRIAIANDDKLEKFEFEITSKALIKGNIYLAKVIRVEPSLQAAFVDYGGGRHGFLGFSEIHPSYYQIPVNDKEEFERHIQNAIDLKSSQNEDGDDSADQYDEGVEDYNISKLRHQFYKRYKIQEVIKKRQVMLVQVVKEERGNKGAALTTFISLAGRYCVVMPNTNRPCGISKKITAPSDRKKMKQILSSLNIQPGMCVVIRTAGLNHTKQEIKKDFEYVIKIWNDIRENVMNSQAPCLVHEEASIIKRTIRDLYTKDVEEIIVDGSEGFKLAKAFMKKILPGHVKKVKQYTDKTSTVFGKYNLDDQINTMYSTRVDLPSGGYLVINPTEALVSIDVNSGKATKERTVGITAIKTNLEAAAEVARQCKLRDLGGLIVVDFIDMDDEKNDLMIERTVREAFAGDSAKVQVSHMSPFGLLEISRQRLHPNLMETHRVLCPCCAGVGSVWSTESLAIQIIRKIEEVCTNSDVQEITISVSKEAALFLMNTKKSCLVNLEQSKNCRILLDIDHDLSISDFSVEVTKILKSTAVENDNIEEAEVEIPHVEETPPKVKQKHQTKINKKTPSEKNVKVKKGKTIRNTRKKTPKEEVSEITNDNIISENSNEKEVPIKKLDTVESKEQASNLNQDLSINLINDTIDFESRYTSMINKAMQVREELEKNRCDVKTVALSTSKNEEQTLKTKKGWWNKLLKN